MPSILQPWVSALGLRHQGTLLAGVRGCDGLPKENPSKYVVRAIRQAILVPFDPRELLIGNSYMSVTMDVLESHAKLFIEDRDHYPMHFWTHIVHATEVIAFCCPGGPDFKPAPHSWWIDFYLRCCHALHMNPETPKQLDDRLNEDKTSTPKSHHEPVPLCDLVAAVKALQ